MVGLGWIADLDGDAACVAVEEARARLVAAEVEEFFLAAHWVSAAGQTGLHNLAPLTRFAHRAKTYGNWVLRQTGPGVYEWRSPHGHRYRIDHTGTHPLGKDAGASDTGGSDDDPGETGPTDPAAS